MKTFTEYEASDIDLKDPVHAFLFGQMLIIALTRFESRPGDDPDDTMLPFLRQIADLLNSAQKAGLSISKSELPAAFTTSKS